MQVMNILKRVINLSYNEKIKNHYYDLLKRSLELSEQKLAMKIRTQFSHFGSLKTKLA